MKNQNPVFVAIVFALAFAFAPVTKAAPGPIHLPPPAPRPDAVESPVITIHSADNVTRGKTGSFVLAMNPALTSDGTYVSAGMYVNFSVSGTAGAGVDYVALISPAYLGRSGYGTILVKTLPDPRAGFIRQAYSVVVTLEPGLGYAVGVPSSATMWIKP